MWCLVIYYDSTSVRCILEQLLLNFWEFKTLRSATRCEHVVFVLGHHLPVCETRHVYKNLCIGTYVIHSCEVARAPFNTSAEACLTGWPNAQPREWGKCSVAWHHQASLIVCVKCRCGATSYFLVMDCASPLACSLVRSHPRDRGVYKG